MKTWFSKSVLASATLLLASMFPVPASADAVFVGSPFNSSHTFTFNGTNPAHTFKNVGAGNFQHSTITLSPPQHMVVVGPIATNAMYCIDLFHTINAPAILLNADINKLGNVTYQGAGVGLNNHANGDADKIAYLMFNMANNANVVGNFYGLGTASITDQQLALQGAIWHYTYKDYVPPTIPAYNGSNGSAPAGSGGYGFLAPADRLAGGGHDAIHHNLVLALYNRFIFLANASYTVGERTKIYWVNAVSGTRPQFQAQVALVGGNHGSIQGPSVPEPSTFALMGLGGLGLAFAAYRRRRPVAV